MTLKLSTSFVSSRKKEENKVTSACNFRAKGSRVSANQSARFSNAMSLVNIHSVHYKWYSKWTNILKTTLGAIYIKISISEVYIKISINTR